MSCALQGMLGLAAAGHATAGHATAGHSAAGHSTVTLHIGGTGSSLGGMRLLANEFVKLFRPDIHIIVLPSLGSNGGIKALLAGKINLSVSARPLTKAEKEKGLRANEYARTPIVLASRYDNPTNNITLSQLISAYSGEHLTWPEGTPIRLIMRPAGEDDTRLVREISPALNVAVNSALQRKDLFVALNDQDNAAALETIPGSLGIIALAQIVTEKRRIKPLTFNGLTGTREMLLTGKYPYVKTYYIITGPKPTSEIQAFLKFIYSPHGREILTRSGHLATSAAANSEM